MSAIEGVVVDERLVPILGALVVSGNESATTDDDGRFRLAVAGPSAVVVTVTALGFQAASVSTTPSASESSLRIQLTRLPQAEPYTTVESFKGFLECAAVIIMEGGEPHNHQGIRCSTLFDGGRDQWLLAVQPDASGLVVELGWNKTSEASNTMVLRANVTATGAPIGASEGLSMVRIQVAADQLRRAQEAGHDAFTITVDAGAGDTEQEEGSVGVFFQQAFTVYATWFFNQPADPAYSIANPRG